MWRRDGRNEFGRPIGKESPLNITHYNVRNVPFKGFALQKYVIILRLSNQNSYLRGKNFDITKLKIVLKYFKLSKMCTTTTL